MSKTDVKDKNAILQIQKDIRNYANSEKLQEIKQLQKFAGLFENYDISQDAKEILWSFIHDKHHGIGSQEDINTINNTIEKNKQKAQIPLYRGFGDIHEKGSLSKNSKIGDEFQINQILSVSEDIKIAKSFSKNDKLIIKIENAEAFPYWKWYIEDMTEYLESDEDADSEGTLELIDLAKKEKEWMFPSNQKFKITNIESIGEYTVISFQQIH
jgi:hypothetical protein